MTVHGGWLDEVDVWVAGQAPLPGMPPADPTPPKPSPGDDRAVPD